MACSVADTYVGTTFGDERDEFGLTDDDDDLLTDGRTLDSAGAVCLINKLSE